MYNDLIESKQMSSGSFNTIINKLCLQIFYNMYKQDLPTINPLKYN